VALPAIRLIPDAASPTTPFSLPTLGTKIVNLLIPADRHPHSTVDLPAVRAASSR
jgi:hypothetical protein